MATGSPGAQAVERPWAVERARAALLVVDMQNDFVNEAAVMEVPMARRLVPNMVKLVAHCRGAGVPVFYTAHTLYDGFNVSPLEVAHQPWLESEGMRAGGAGAEIIEALKPAAGEIVIRKHRYDAFHNTQLETLLRNVRGPGVVDTLIVIGTVTNVCCESTARSAFMRDFKVVMVSDANGGFDETSQQATLTTIAKVFGRVLTTDETIARL